MAEYERVYNHYDQWKSVTQFSMISVSLTHGVHNDPTVQEAVKRAKENLGEAKEIIRKEMKALKEGLSDATQKGRTEILNRLKHLNGAVKLIDRYFKGFIMIIVIDPETGLPVGMIPSPSQQVL